MFSWEIMIMGGFIHSSSCHVFRDGGTYNMYVWYLSYCKYVYPNTCTIQHQCNANSSNTNNRMSQPQQIQTFRFADSRRDQADFGCSLEIREQVCWRWRRCRSSLDNMFTHEKRLYNQKERMTNHRIDHQPKISLFHYPAWFIVESDPVHWICCWICCGLQISSL